MNLLSIILYTIIIVLLVINMIAEYSRVLMMMQQNSYRPERYMRWLRAGGDTTSAPKLVGYAVTLVSLAAFTAPLWGCVILGAFASGSAIVLLRKKYKKPLVWTPRVRRIFTVMLVLSVLVVGVGMLMALTAGATMLYGASVALSVLFCGSHIVVLGAVVLLTPVEKSINRGYYRDAERILRSMPSLKVVGITGSYGKTSTKHYLYRILSEQFETLMTPGSYNTTLGVIRTVREMLKPYCEVFICEMGAKQKGDIREICELVHPQIGIVTAVGPQHLESFGSIDNVRDTKFELIDALPSDGLAVVNNDFSMIADRKVDNVKCLRYGVSACDGEVLQFRADNISYSPSGSTFVVTDAEGNSMTMHTRLVGECNVSNLLAAVAVALHLGMSVESVARAVEKIEQVEHRLNVKRTPGGITIIDDAFNSNPTGSAMALDVLKAMTGGRRFVITPGMIELGDEQCVHNYRFGSKIARSADVAIVVGEYNRDAIVEGFESVEDSTAELHTVATFAEAQQLMLSMARSGDTVLYENDLPDTFR